MRKLITNLLVMTVSVVVVFGGAELAVRDYVDKKIRTYFDDQTIQEFGYPIPKKEPGEYRIFIFGGSSAYGFPVADRYSIAAWLRKSFPHLLPGKKVRVVNCGWPGKSSHQVVEGAHTVMRYEPDLFIIYSGHNDVTVSNRLYLDNRLYWFNQRLSYRSALYRWLSNRIGRIRKKLTYGSSGYPEKLYRDEVIANRVYKRIDITDEDYERILKRYRKNMESVLKVTKRHGVDVLFVNLPSNIRDIPPSLSTHISGLTTEQLGELEKQFKLGEELMSQKKYQEAIRTFERVLTIDSSYAEAWFKLGNAYEGMEAFESAKMAYVKARDLDRQPFRAKSSMNELIKQITEEHSLIFVDLVKAFEDLSPHGIIGSSLIHDNVHPSVQAQQLIADEICRALAARSKIASSESWQWRALESVQEDKESEEWKIDGTVNAYRYVLRGLQLWGQKRYEEAVPDLEKGLELMPKFIESYAFLADAYWHLGKRDKALGSFQTLASKDEKLFQLLIGKYPEIGQSYNETIRTMGARPVAFHS